MFAFASKFLPVLLLAAPALVGCAAATGDPSESSSQALDSAVTRTGVDVPVTLQASPKSKCAVTTTDEGNGRIDQFTAETDEQGFVDMSVTVDDEKPFLVTLDCEGPGHLRRSYSFQLKSSAHAMQVEKLEARVP